MNDLDPRTRVTRHVDPGRIPTDDHDPPYLYPDYVGTRLRSPSRPLVPLPHGLTELSGPVFGKDEIRGADADLTRHGEAEPLGERIVVHGRVMDSDGRGVANSLVEVWQANAAGRYAHDADQHPAPIDANFRGIGRAMTERDGSFRFVTIKPGAYPWRNHYNAWRPAHIHFSLFGHAFTQRLVTQMYFPGDPLLGQDPIFNAVPATGREALIARFDPEATMPEWALAYRFDIVLRGRDATPFEGQEDES